MGLVYTLRYLTIGWAFEAQDDIMRFNQRPLAPGMRFQSGGQEVTEQVILNIQTAAYEQKNYPSGANHTRCPVIVVAANQIQPCKDLASKMYADSHACARLGWIAVYFETESQTQALPN